MQVSAREGESWCQNSFKGTSQAQANAQAHRQIFTCSAIEVEGSAKTRLEVYGSVRTRIKINTGTRQTGLKVKYSYRTRGEAYCG